ncbi:MAG: MGMT family protein [Armatimonadetes bacterium]|nr:MGMT family protein [Armatimonadota bacterium]
MRTRTSWREKLHKDHPAHGKVVDVPPKMQKQWGTGTMVIPKPLALDALIRTIKKGKLVTVSQLMQRVAKDSGADYACPMTTGVFLSIVAHAAEEDLYEGKKRVTPYWRVLKSEGSLNPKFPGGVAHQAERLVEEGHAIDPAHGKKPPKVRDYEKRLQQL